MPELPRWTLKVCSECGNHQTAFALCEHQQAVEWDSPDWGAAFESVEVVPLSRLEAAEGERDEAEDKCRDLIAECARLVGERDRLRDRRNRLEKALVLISQHSHDPEAVDTARLALAGHQARAALSTGDRQDDDFGVRTGVPTQPGIAGQDSGGEGA